MTDKLVAEFMANKGVTHCPPANAAGSNASRATREMVAKKRRDWRKAKKAKQG